MTATDELRRLLDEREVEYETLSFYDATWWKDACGFEWYYGEDDDGHTIIEALDPTPEQAIAATLGAGACKEVYLLMATDIGDGREEVLGAYATEEAAIAAINENQFGYALHHVCKLEVTS